MAVYSLDLRKKIVEVYQRGNTSIRKVADQFMVTKRTVHRLVKQYRETGNVEAKKPGTKVRSVLEQHRAIILAMVEEYSDWTLWQYCEALGEKTGDYVSTSTMCQFLKKEKLTLKKNFP